MFFAFFSRMNEIELKSLPTLLRRQEAARALGVSLPTLKRLIRRGELAGTKVGGQTRIRLDELRDFIHRQTRRGAAA